MLVPTTTPLPPPRDQALFLDFDGTLVDIAPSPDSIELDPMLTHVLSRLHEQLHGAVAIVSGRPIAEIDGWLAPLTLPCAGGHGAECRSHRGLASLAAPAGLGKVTEQLAILAAEHAGLWLEHKSASVALHYREAPELHASLRAAITKLLQCQPALRLLEGKHILEILPRQVSKGRAIESFLQEPPFAGRRPVFLGDDVTDEAGFDFVQRHGGIAVKVGAGDSCARFRLDNPNAVRQWLFAAAGLTESTVPHANSA